MHYHEDSMPLYLRSDRRKCDRNVLETVRQQHL